MNISLKTLIQVAPFPQKDREMLLGKYDQLNEDDKYKLSNAAWRALSIQYFTKLQIETNHILREIQEGKRDYNPNDFEEAKTKLLHELTEKLQLTSTETSLLDIRKQLEQYKPQAPASPQKS